LRYANDEEVTSMDRQTRHELDNLLSGYREALDEVARAMDDEERIHAWRQVQTLGWRLHELLPSATASFPA
jgi:hypothetical protein